MNHKKEKTHRIFFALWPDDATRLQIVEALKQLNTNKKQGRMVKVDNLHITLHFIGNVNQQKLDCMHKVAQTVEANGFELELDHFGYFYKSKVLWMGLKQKPDALMYLYRILGEALMECDYQVEHRPYAPHVTLVRKLAKPEELDAFKTINWQIDSFALVESISVEGEVHYEVLERYFLKD